MNDSEMITKEITEEELKEIASGVNLPLVKMKCAECYNEATVSGFVLRNKKTGSLLSTYFAKPLCEACGKKRTALYSSDKWAFER